MSLGRRSYVRSEDKRTRQLNLRISENELARLEAATQGRAMTTYAREWALTGAAIEARLEQVRSRLTHPCSASELLLLALRALETLPSLARSAQHHETPPVYPSE